MVHIALYKNSQEKIGTDCSFIFKNVKVKVNGAEHEVEKVIHAHRCVLSAVSPYFATNLKTTWTNGQPIEVTTVRYEVFEKIIRTIYLCDIQPTANLAEAIELYEATHFYQLDGVFEVIQNEIIRMLKEPKLMKCSKLITLVIKYEDHRLFEFFRKYFIKYAEPIISKSDFLDYPITVINMFYQIDDLLVQEESLVDALEKYIEKHGADSLHLLQPAIRAIRFGTLPAERIASTSLLSDVEKHIAITQSSSQFSYLSRAEEGRTKKIINNGFVF